MNVKRTFAATLAILAIAAHAYAQEEENGESSAWKPSLELSIDHTSRYLSEGNVGNPDPVDTIGLTVEFPITDDLSLHLGGTAIYDETNACDNRRNVEEWDWNAGFTFTLNALPAIGALEINFDYLYYNYPHDKAHTHDTDTKEYEIDITATELFLSPGVVFVHDFENDVIKGNFNITCELPLDNLLENLSFECPLELWAGNHQYTGCTSGTTAYSICAQPTLNYEINENLSVATYVQMGWALDSRVRRDWKDDENNNAFNACWGLNMTVSF